MSLNRVRDLIQAGDRIFALTALGQAAVFVLLSFLGLGVYIFSSARISEKVISSVFRKWEPTLTEGVYIAESVSSAEVTEIKALTSFEDALRASGVDAKVDLIGCETPGALPLKIGEMRLKNCVLVNVQHTSVLSVVAGVMAAILLSLLLMGLVWVRFRKSIRIRFYEPLIASIRSELQDATTGKVAAQVAHDIRSPLAALNMISKDLSQISEDKRVLVRAAINRIQDIANNLLTISKQNLDSSTKREDVFLSTSLESIVTEKRLQYRSNNRVEISANISTSAYGVFVNLDSVEFSRIISNIVNNSVEAFSKNGGVVTIDLEAFGDVARVRVMDNGRGIPPDVVAILGNRGVSIGKVGGSGLGLFHAKSTVESWGGRFWIESIEGSGTTVFIEVPVTSPPPWFVDRVMIEGNAKVVIVDDDDSIHRVWDGRFESAMIPNTIIHFANADDLKAWTTINPSEDALFLIDYELLGSADNGLDLIETLKINKRSILVTSRFEEQSIRARCEKLGVKLVPKNLAGFVPLVRIHPI